MPEPTPDFPEKFLKDDPMESLGLVDTDETQFGIAVFVRSGYREVVHEETGEHLGYYGENEYTEVILNPDTLPEKNPWMSYEEAEEHIEEEYEQENAEQYVEEGKAGVDLSECHVVIGPIRRTRMEFV